MKKSKKNEEKFLADIDNAVKAPRKKVKVRITAMIDADIIDELKKLAHKDDVKYQTLLNAKLRESLFDEAIIDRDVILSITEKIKKLEKKVNYLEKRA